MNDPNNYRGLTITSAIDKLFNRIMNTRLDNFLIKNKIIDDCQIGFTKKGPDLGSHVCVKNHNRQILQ